MIVDFEKDEFPPDNGFDVCVVGAGAAGLSLAHELVGAGMRVILLEGGGASRWERRSQALNKAHSVGHRFDGAHAGRFRTLGGTTSAWAGQVMELDAADFERRDWVNGAAWPISKSALASYYRRASSLERTDDLVQDDDAVWSAVGVPRPQIGLDLQIAFSRYCPEKKFVRLFSRTISDPRLAIVCHANAVELDFDESRRRIVSVKVKALSGREARCRAKAFALCLGGIESSRFLLNQNYAPWNKSKLVGRHFQDHIQCFAAKIEDGDLRARHWPFGPWRLGGVYLPKIKLTHAAQRAHGTLNVGGLIEHSDGVWASLRTGIQIVTGPSSAVRLSDVLATSIRTPMVAWHHFKTKQDPNYILPYARPYLSVYCEQPPDSKSSVTLSSEVDGVGLRRAEICWRISDMEMKSIRTFVKLVKGAFEERKIARILPVANLDEESFQRRFIDTFHHCGGTRMAEVETDGVVDSDLKLFGVENGYVCSTSVFPSSGFANPTHTLIALGIRLADHLVAAFAETRAPDVKLRLPAAAEQMR